MWIICALLVRELDLITSVFKCWLQCTDWIKFEELIAFCVKSKGVKKYLKFLKMYILVFNVFMSQPFLKMKFVQGKTTNYVNIGTAV